MGVFMSRAMERGMATTGMRNRIKTTPITKMMNTRITTVMATRLFMIMGTEMEAPIAARM